MIVRSIDGVMKLKMSSLPTPCGSHPFQLSHQLYVYPKNPTGIDSNLRANLGADAKEKKKKKKSERIVPPVSAWLPTTID
jgi:hypothetical protein